MKLDKYEKEILDAYNQGKLKKIVPTKKTQRELKQIARNTLAKDRRVNIRISSKDLQDIQQKALEEGLPYQTLMSSVLHKYVAEKLVDVSTLPKQR